MNIANNSQQQPVIRKIIAKNLSRFMKESRTCHNQPALASRSGIAQRTIGRILNEDIGTGSDTIEQIANALGRQVYEFYIDPDAENAELKSQYSSEEVLEHISNSVSNWTDEQFNELIGALKVLKSMKSKDRF